MESKQLIIGKHWYDKKVWLSICSAHYEYDPNCNMCNAGMYHPKWKLDFRDLLRKYSPNIVYQLYMGTYNFKNK